MDQHLLLQLNQLRGNIEQQYQLTHTDESTVTTFILREMVCAQGDKDWEVWDTLLGMALAIDDDAIKANVLNQLLIMPSHQLHQEVTREIQFLGHPSSVPYIRQVLESNFDFLAYTCSCDAAIAKWFSHALADIGSAEAIDLIYEFRDRDNPEIAEEMAYRLARLGRA